MSAPAEGQETVLPIIISTDCGHKFEISAEAEQDWAEVIADLTAKGPGAQGPTFDCKICDTLLMVEAVADERLVVGRDFHKAMNESDPRWPADGSGTSVVTF